MRSPIATTAARISAVIWCHGTLTPKTVTTEPSQNLRMGRAFDGFQIQVAAPIVASIRASVTTSLVVSEVPSRRRIISNSSSAPASGARMNSTTNNATGAGQFHPKRICQ